MPTANWLETEAATGGGGDTPLRDLASQEEEPPGQFCGKHVERHQEGEVYRTGNMIVKIYNYNRMTGPRDEWKGGPGASAGGPQGGVERLDQSR